MGIKVKIFYPELEKLIGNPDNLTVEARTVGEGLNELIKLYPGAQKLLFDKQGNLLKNVFVYVNAESLNKAELSRPLSDKDELIVAVLITGG